MSFNEFFGELYDQTLVLGAASAFSVAALKFLKMSLGAPVSLKPFLMMALALGVGAMVVKKIQEKYDFLDNPMRNKKSG